jgi:hypothetical protein
VVVRQQHLALIQAALVPEGVSAAELQLAVRDADVTTPWLMEAATLKLKLELDPKRLLEPYRLLIIPLSY